jgi:ketosteroid isomerase-like protein
MRLTSLDAIPDALPPAFAEGDPLHAARAEEKEHLGILQAMMAAIAAGDERALRAHLAPQVEFELSAPAEFGWARRARGSDAVADAITGNFRRVREQAPELLSVVGQGDTLMLTARETGVVVASGQPYQVMLAQQYTFDDQHRLLRFRAVVAHDPGGDPS